MANNPATAFTGKIEAPTPGFPYGKARDVSQPGDRTGTPWVAQFINDIFGFQQALLDAAGLTPSGVPDEVGASQYLDALTLLFSGSRYATLADLIAATDTAIGSLVQTTGRDNVGDGYQATYLIQAAQTVNEVTDFTLADGNVAILQGEAFNNLVLSGDAATAEIVFDDFDNAGNGRITYDFSDGTFSFDSESNTRMWLRGNGDLGLNAENPFGKMHVRTSATGATSASSSADDLVLESVGSAGLTILSGDSSPGCVYFGTSVDNDRGRFRFNHDDLNYTWGFGANDVMELDNEGRMRLNVDSALPVGYRPQLHIEKWATSSPTLKLDDVTQSGADWDTGARDLVIDNGNNEFGMSFIGTDVSTQTINFADVSETRAGAVEYNHFEDYLQLYANGVPSITLGAATGRPLMSIQHDPSLVNASATLDLIGNSTATFRLMHRDTTRGTIQFWNRTGGSGAGGAHALIEAEEFLDRMVFRQGIQGANETRLEIDAAGLSFASDGSKDIGTATRRANDIYAVNGTIQTSDAAQKKVRGELTAEEVAAWADVSPKVYQWLSAIEEKGEEAARFHFGYIAQEVEAALVAHGLDPDEYALFTKTEVMEDVIEDVEYEAPKTTTEARTSKNVEIRDGVPTMVVTTEEVEIQTTEEVVIVDEEGNPVTSTREAIDEEGNPYTEEVTLTHPVLLTETKTRQEVTGKTGTGVFKYGLRYAECAVFEAAYQRAIVADLAARLETLENQ